MYFHGCVLRSAAEGMSPLCAN
uniref:Uncharacterized protein n=1 Tax=Anguilla anguilla TaxID=7936 RepID=A0A0E9QDQ3_ANGAN